MTADVAKDIALEEEGGGQCWWSQGGLVKSQRYMEEGTGEKENLDLTVMRQRRSSGPLLPLQLHFILRPNLMRGSFGVTGLGRKRDTKQAQNYRPKNPGCDLGGTAQAGFHFGPDRNQKPGHVVEIVTSIHGCTHLLRQQERGSLEYAAKSSGEGVPL
jgi:hypothetical protein